MRHCWLLACILFLTQAIHAAAPLLPGTRPLAIKQPLDVLMVDGLRRFCLRELAASTATRAKHWKRDFTSPRDYSLSIAANRSRFREIIGAVDERLTARAGHRGGFEELALLGTLTPNTDVGEVTLHAVRWPVLDGLTAEGILLKPKNVRAAVVVLPDAKWLPEQSLGFNFLENQSKIPFRLAAKGCMVVVPMLIGRSDRFSGNPAVRFTNQPHREYIYRQAFEMGRHVVGYEVQKALAAVDLFAQMRARRKTPLPIGIAGDGEGGLLAFYAAALDERIDAALISGYFQKREGVWREPIYRNVWGLLTEFGDAEIAGMISPRRLVIEACQTPRVKGPPKPRPGRAGGAPGRIEAIQLDSVRPEFEKAKVFYHKLRKPDELVLVVSGTGQGPPGSAKAVQSLAAGLGVAGILNGWKFEPTPMDQWPKTIAREQRQLDEMQAHVQRLLKRSAAVRAKKWRTTAASPDEWRQRGNVLRKWVHEELIGRLPHQKLPFNPRTQRVVANEHFAAYEVMLDVFPDVVAGGLLLLPKDLKAGERRPVVVCQHGLEGAAMDTLSREPRAFRFYKAFSAELCRRGFIVYAPQNPYRGKDRFRVLQRMSNPLKRTIFSYIIAQHQQTLAWLATLPQVDARRIAFYGLSYGGKTAVRVPPFVPGYCLSICSADFTDWVRSIATNNHRAGYLFTSEYEIPEWNMGHVASHADLAMLMTPRPFMVEAGRKDGGQPVAWVQSEFAKVRRHYEALKIANRAALELFDDGHTIHGQGTFRFLHHHLKWPEPRR